MRDGTYYLNNNGSRWVVFENGQKSKCIIHTDEGYELRTVLFYEQFGNFATACISYKGKKIKKFMDRRFSFEEEVKYYGLDAYRVFPKHWEGMGVINLRTKRR